MPKSNVTTTKKPVKQPVKPQTSEQTIKAWARTICAGGDDPDLHTAAFLLLLDEIERSCQDWMRVDVIVGFAKSSGFRESNHSERALREFVARLREQKNLRLVRAS